MSNEGGDATGDVSQVKEDWGDIYVAPSPMPYFHVMTPTDYGRYHDQFLHIFEKELLQEFDIQKSLKVVEFGTSYGNTTLANKCGMDWQTVGSVWNDDTVKLIVVRDIYVTAVDKSVEALNYGLKRGIFDEIVPFDFNTTPLPTVMTTLNDADLLVMIMVSFYTRTNTYMKPFSTFWATEKRRRSLRTIILMRLSHATSHLSAFLLASRVGSQLPTLQSIAISRKLRAQRILEQKSRGAQRISSLSNLLKAICSKILSRKLTLTRCRRIRSS